MLLEPLEDLCHELERRRLLELFQGPKILSKSNKIALVSIPDQVVDVGSLNAQSWLLVSSP